MRPASRDDAIGCGLRLGLEARAAAHGAAFHGEAVSNRRRTVVSQEAFEIAGLRVSLERTQGVTATSRSVCSHADVAPLLSRFIGRASDREHLVAALLDRDSQLIGLALLAVGCGNTVQVRTRPTCIGR